MDITAINYMQCCYPNPPGCVPAYPDPECCEYEGEPDPCKTNPKDCWFCEPSDISTAGWVDPMAILNANGGCIQFGSTNASFSSSYTGQMYQTQTDCAANSKCGPTIVSGGEKTECHRCHQGSPISNMFPTPPGCPPGWETIPPFNPDSCEHDLDTVDTLTEEIKRFRELL